MNNNPTSNLVDEIPCFVQHSLRRVRSLANKSAVDDSCPTEASEGRTKRPELVRATPDQGLSRFGETNESIQQKLSRPGREFPRLSSVSRFILLKLRNGDFADFVESDELMEELLEAVDEALHIANVMEGGLSRKEREPELQAKIASTLALFPADVRAEILAEGRDKFIRLMH
jgi:hypothetical protein